MAGPQVTDDALPPLTAQSPFKFACGLCPRRFFRQDHLKRHTQTHGREKLVKCRYCEKTFGRKDAAQRHEQLHTRLPRAVGQAPEALLVTICRTCSVCAKSRIRCSGGIPCDHCSVRNLECKYRPRKRKRPSHGALHAADLTPAPNTQDPPTMVTDTSGEQLFANTDPSPSATLWPPSPDPASLLAGSVLSQDAGGPRIATNWLPFVHSGPGGALGTYASNTVPVPDGCGDLGQPAPEVHDGQTTIESEIEGSGLTDLENSFFFQQDQVSALIKYMQNGSLVTSSHLADSDNPNRDCASPPHNRLYADGAGFRESQADRSILERRAAFPRQSESGSEHQLRFTWTAILLEKIRLGRTKRPRHDFEIPESIFHEVQLRLCPPGGRPLLSAESLAHRDILLQRDTFNYLIRLYFDHFHPVYPFLDRSLLCIPVWGWSLCLATAAIGTRYLGFAELTRSGDDLCSSLHELLMRELDFGRVEDSLPYIQARSLAAVGLCQSRQPQLMKCGYSALSMVCNSCLQLRLLDEDDTIGAYEEGQSLEQVWLAWRFRETRRRTGLFIWLLDGGFAFTSEHPPNLPSRRLNLRLPSVEALWEAASAEAWFKALPLEPVDGITALLGEESTRVAVSQATEALWSNLTAPAGTTEFSTVVVIHVLLRRKWDTCQYLDEPILTAPPTSDTPLHGRDDRYLGAMPAYTQWRNYTCDCLDVIHWETLSLSARAGGLESPVFLHLHLSRLLILVPVRELLEHSCGNIRNDMSGNLLPHNLYQPPRPGPRWQQIVLTWAHQDRYKARLAVIHAGAVFWHVRRYASYSFMEPFTTFLSALVLWAFASSQNVEQQPRPVAAQSNEAHVPVFTPTDNDAGRLVTPSSDLQSGVHQRIGSVASPAPSLFSSSSLQRTGPSMARHRRMPKLIQLDRPIDDELVQHFIRSGDGMRLYLEGVDDLCAPAGPAQVLREAVGILLEQPVVWPVSESYAEYLDCMIL